MYPCKGQIVMIFSIAFLTVLAAGCYVQTAYAASFETLEEDGPHVLVVFSSKNGEIDHHQRMLDMLLGRFTHDITFKASTSVEEKDVQTADYLFYYGEQKEVLPESFVRIVTHFKGKMVAIGHNVEQLGDNFSFVEQVPIKAVIERISSADHPQKHFSINPSAIMNINLPENELTETILIGKKDHLSYPLFVRQQGNYYFASSDLRPPFSIAFAEGLHDVFTEDVSRAEQQSKNPGYLRLEDIHPLVDPDHMMEIARILKEKDIPYMVAVIPVYTNPVTGKQYHFSDSPELLKVLKYMQDNGGSIILHGYTHQYRQSETGEGFEFWDVEHNMPIYHGHVDRVVAKTADDFTSVEAYEQYMNERKAFERKYIEERLSRGIQELANYGLYPLAFEAPHYTMSQHGYEVAAEYFSTYSGQLQLSDENWEIMSTAPYVTRPTFLQGMLLLPETIGYLQPENPQAIEQMMDRAHQYMFVRDGMVAGFYHPYLGVELFHELIEQLTQLDVSWIDLKQLDHHVRADHVEIRTEHGEIIVDMNRWKLFMDSLDLLYYHIGVYLKRFTWLMAMIGILALVTFTIYILINSTRNEPMKRGDEIG
mgnify:CR=1 FL=1